MKALELENVYFRQDNFIMSDISFAIEEGETVAIQGVSGSGKSTLIRLIGNASMVDSGIIRYFGKELYEDEKNIRRNLSVIYDKINFSREMRAKKLAKEIRRFEPDFDMEAFEEYLQKFELDPEQRIRYYSDGMRKKYMLSLALARKPKLLIMDELTKSLEEETREVLWQAIEQYRKTNKLTILFATSSKEDIVKSNARVISIEGGKIL